MAKQKMGEERKTFYCSSSVSNFKEKLRERLGIPLMESSKDYTIFFGLYHYLDYIRFLKHRGPKKIFWCGGDIRNLRKKPMRHVLAYIFNKYQNYFENSVEAIELYNLGIGAEIVPMIFDNMEMPVAFSRPTDKIHVYTSVREGRVDEYGLNRILDLASAAQDIHFHVYGIMRNRGRRKNLTFHGEVSNEQFNKEIQNYHGALRLNEHDGFSETLAKSALMGQYPVSFIQYPFIISPAGKRNRSIIKAIRRIWNKKGPNHTGRDYWVRTLNESMNKVLA